MEADGSHEGSVRRQTMKASLRIGRTNGAIPTHPSMARRKSVVRSIIYIVGLVVIVLVILRLAGLA